MQVRWRAAVLSAVAAGGLVGLSVLPQQASAAPQPMKYNALTKIQKRLLSGFASSEADQARGAIAATPKAATTSRALTAKALPAAGRFYYPGPGGGCGYTLANAVNMDRECQNVTDGALAGRGQAQNEVFISEDHFHPATVLGSSNDYRRGDGGCFAYNSTNGGRSFNDVAVPFGFTAGGAYGGFARQYWQSGGDTSSAFDSRGNAYFSCQVFNRGTVASANPDLSSALIVFRSTGNGGASYTFPARVVTEFPDVAGTGNGLLDKQLLTVDSHVGSRFRDRVYVTWTFFAADGSGYIYESHSSDYAETWSKPVVVSTTSSLCTNTYGAGTPFGTCNENQDSQPFTGPDGALYVVFTNYNNPETTNTTPDNRNQILLAKSTDGGNSFSPPVKVTDFFDLPDCVTYTGQDAGRLCVPDKRDNTSYFRATNYPVGVVDPTNPQHIAVTVGSYINAHSNESNGCSPAGVSALGTNLYNGVLKVGACNNDIIVSSSTNGGASFTGTTTDPRHMRSVTQAPRQRTTDQWFQWADYTRDGRLAVSYYDRQYGNSELTGYNDISLSGSRNLSSFGTVRVTSSSMPSSTQFGGLFWGDYTGLAAYTGTAHPSWSDTRTPEVFTCPGTATTSSPPAICTGVGRNAPNDQEAMTARLAVPAR